MIGTRIEIEHTYKNNTTLEFETGLKTVTIVDKLIIWQRVQLGNEKAIAHSTKYLIKDETGNINIIDPTAIKQIHN